MDREEIIEDITEHYSKDTITYLLMLVGVEPERSFRKFDLVMVLVDTLSDNKYMEALFGRISPTARTVIKHLTWEGVSTLRDIDIIYGIKSCNDDYYYNSTDPFISIFKSKYNREIQLSTGLRTLFKRYFIIEIPENNIELNNVDLLTSTPEIYQSIDGVWEFIESRMIQERDYNKSLYKRDINAFLKEYKLEDPFYPIISELFLRFLSFRKDKSVGIKEYFNAYYRGTLSEENLDRYFFYPFIKGLNSINSIDLFLKRARYAFLNHIKKSRGWITVDSVVRVLSLQEETHIFDTSWFGSLMEVRVKEPYQRDFAPTMNLQMKRDSEILLLKPLLRGVLSILHLLGGVELGLDRSHNEFGVSPLEPISCFRLTDRGLYLLGEINSLDEESRGDESVIFHPDLLLVEFHGKRSSTLNFLNRVSKSLGDGYYSINCDTFMREISDEKSFYYNLEKLEEFLGEDISDHWERFIYTLKERLYPTYNEVQMIVVNFPRENREFLELVQNREDIRKLYMMVEDFRAAFTTSAYKEFKRLIKDSGFIV